MSLSTAGIGDSLPQELALEEARGLNSGLNWNVWWRGESGNMSRPSDTDELGLGVVWSTLSPFLSASIFFLTRPLFFSYLDVSILVARLRAAFPGFASGLIIHQELLPVPSFCTRIKRLWSDRLCRMEFCFKKRDKNSINCLFLEEFLSGYMSSKTNDENRYLKISAPEVSKTGLYINKSSHEEREGERKGREVP